MSRRTDTARGFTLIEIMIVLTLIGILTAVVIPSVVDRTNTFDVAEQARHLHTEISKLRGRAVAERLEQELSLSNGETVTISRVNADGTKTVMHTVALKGNATATLNGASSGTVTFYPTGRVDQAADLRVFGADRTRKIRILASGMVRWETE